MNNARPVFNIDPTPTLPTRGCRMAARLVAWALSYGHYAIALAVWWKFDWFFAIAILLLGFILLGIIRSKLRNDSIPPSQREFPYDDYAIASWYLSRNHCFTFPPQSDDNVKSGCDGSAGNCCGTPEECENIIDAQECPRRDEK